MFVSGVLSVKHNEEQRRGVYGAGLGSLVVGAALSVGAASGAERGPTDLESLKLDLNERSATLEIADSTSPLLCLLGIQVPNALRIKPRVDSDGNTTSMTAEQCRAIPFDRIADLNEFSLVRNPSIKDRDLIGLFKTSVRSVEVVGGAVDGSFLGCLPRDTVEDLEITDVRLKPESFTLLRQYQELKILSLNNAGVDDEALAMIAQAPSLRTIVLRGPGVTVGGILELCANPSVKYIGAEVSRAPTAKERAELDKVCEERPDLKIVLTVVSDEERLSNHSNHAEDVAEGG